jgi:peptide/nickel transport system substrate-binding protein
MSRGPAQSRTAAGLERSAFSVLVIGVVWLTLVASATPAAPPPTFKNGGTLTIGLAEDPDALDPTLSSTTIGWTVFVNMCEKLYDLNPKLEVVPQLAAALPKFSENKKTVTIKLRTGIKFNDGTPFTAPAVKQSLERHKALPRSARASDLAPVASIDTQGDDTVILHLSNRYAPLMSYLARTGWIMSPKALNELGDTFATHPVCVGPFMFKERITGDHITLVRSPYYYDKKKVHLDSIVFRIMIDPAARTANLRARSIDVEDRIQSTDLPSIKNDSNVRVIKQVSLGYTGITINIGNKNGVLKGYENIDTPLAKSADLRQAFELALDRNLINHVVYGGVHTPNCFAIARASSYFRATKGLPCHLAANVAAAKAAFERSGAIAPVDVHLMLGTTPIGAREGALIQEMEKKVGFNVILEPTETATGGTRALAGRFEAWLIAFGGGFDPDQNLYRQVNSKGTNNYSGYANPVVDRATNQGRSIVNSTRRVQEYHAALAQLAKDLPIIYMRNNTNRYGVSKRIWGVQAYDGLIRAAFAAFKK